MACGAEGDRDALVRLVVSPEGQVVIDLRARLPGRGGWVHPTRACVARVAAEPRRLARTLKAEVDTSGLERALTDVVLGAVLDGLSLASRAGMLIGGHDALEIAMRDGRISELITADDAADRTIADLARAFGDHPVTRLPVDKDELGRRVGQPPRAAVGLVAGRPFEHLREQLRRLRSLG